MIFHQQPQKLPGTGDPRLRAVFATQFWETWSVKYPPGPLDKVWMAETKALISLACIEPWEDALMLQNADFQGLFANESHHAHQSSYLSTPAVEEGAGTTGLRFYSVKIWIPLFRRGQRGAGITASSPLVSAAGEVSVPLAVLEMTHGKNPTQWRFLGNPAGKCTWFHSPLHGLLSR